MNFVEFNSKLTCYLDDQLIANISYFIARMESAKLIQYKPGVIVAIEVPFKLGSEIKFNAIVQQLKPRSNIDEFPVVKNNVDDSIPSLPPSIILNKKNSYYENIVEKLERKYVTHAFHPQSSPAKVTAMLLMAMNPVQIMKRNRTIRSMLLLLQRSLSLKYPAISGSLWIIMTTQMGL